MSNPNEIMPDYMAALLGKNKTRSKFETLKAGSSIFRILPSFNPANRDISKLWNTHYLSMPNEKGMSVLCTLYTAERHCPLCDRARELEDLIKRAKESKNDDKAKELEETRRNVSRNSKVYYNAVNSSGELVILQLSKTASKALETKIIEAVNEKRFDPLSVDSGVPFKFVRTGMGFDTEVTVDFQKTSFTDADGDIVEKLTKSSIAKEIVDGIEGKVADIFNADSCFIKQLTARDLSSYLRGETIEIPQRGNRSNNTQGGGSVSSQPMTEAPAPQAAAPQAEARVQQKSVVSTPAARTESTGNSMAEEIARLKAMQASHTANRTRSGETK